ncbi:CRISPR-associated protein Cas4 [Candidatus Altiarchaeales archaeon WOR_SM1_SCG]|nr:CRISPR-associated protein Cas4 [Candidatus Altiarchaeales archaeon WOR_SM1_SCG]
MNETYITVSDVMEYLFCPRFIYFMYCLDIKQHEDKRYKVLKGRKVHEVREKINKDYIRKKLNCTRKESSVYMASKKHHVKGIVDEVLFMDDGTASPFDYKYAEDKGKLFKTYKYQSVIYGLLIKENYNVDVRKGFICYTRSNNSVKEITFKEKDFTEAVKIINEILDIIQKGVYPKKTKSLMRCVDCTYRNICV